MELSSAAFMSHLNQHEIKIHLEPSSVWVLLVHFCCCQLRPHPQEDISLYHPHQDLQNISTKLNQIPSLVKFSLKKNFVYKRSTQNMHVFLSCMKFLKWHFMMMLQYCYNFSNKVKNDTQKILVPAFMLCKQSLCTLSTSSFFILVLF